MQHAFRLTVQYAPLDVCRHAAWLRAALPALATPAACVSDCGPRAAYLRATRLATEALMLP